MKSSWGVAVGVLVACSGAGAPGKDDGTDTAATSTASDTEDPTPPDTDTDTHTDTDTEPPGDGPDFRPRVATIRVTDQRLEGYLYDGALPWDYEEVGRDGACRGLSLGVPVCDPPCAGGDWCVGDDQCAPYPRLLSAGTLTVDGVPGITTLDPANPPVYSAAVGALPGPDEIVRVEAAGDTLGPFALETSGVTELVLDPLPERAPGEDLVLTWVPEAGSRIRARIAVDHAHRLAPEVVECEGPDTGELRIAGALLDLVMESPNWGCGVCFGHSVQRYRGDRVDVDGVPVDLEVVSAVGLPPRF